MTRITSILVFIAVIVAVVWGVNFLLGTQTITKKFGGTTTVELPAGKKLVPYTVQWEPKGADLWYLTEDAEEGYSPKKYEFHETSNMGVLEGTIVFQEH